MFSPNTILLATTTLVSAVVIAIPLYDCLHRIDTHVDQLGEVIHQVVAELGDLSVKVEK